MIQLPDGTTVPVTAENIVGLSDTIDYLVARRKMIFSDLRSVMHQLSSLQKEQHAEEEQLAFFKSESLIEVFDKKIASVPINAVAIGKEIKRFVWHIYRERSTSELSSQLFWTLEAEKKWIKPIFS